ncbi:MAG: hypothetical protein LUC20_00870 [Oscillospiraceae bacterium]|nr:hypothetical protein [Oscillospiraceae bacterium]
MSLRRMYAPPFVCCLAVFLAALILVTLNFAADEANWFANLFSYRFYHRCADAGLSADMRRA